MNEWPWLLAMLSRRSQSQADQLCQQRFDQPRLLHQLQGHQPGAAHRSTRLPSRSAAGSHPRTRQAARGCDHITACRRHDCSCCRRRTAAAHLAPWPGTNIDMRKPTQMAPPGASSRGSPARWLRPATGQCALPARACQRRSPLAGREACTLPLGEWLRGLAASCHERPQAAATGRRRSAPAPPHPAARAASARPGGAV